MGTFWLLLNTERMSWRKLSLKLWILQAPGINPCKQVEMFEKYRSVMPPQAVNDVLYKKPDDARCNVLKKVKTEKGMRKVFRGELSDKKKRKRRDDRDEAKKML